MCPKLSRNGHTWCNIRLLDVEGETLEASFPMVMLKGTYNFPDIKKIEEEDSVKLEEWVNEAGLTIKGDTQEEKSQFTKDAATLCAYFAPDLPLDSDGMKLFTWILTLSFLGDDTLEGKDLLGRDITNATEMASIAGDIFRGKYNSLQSIPFNEESYGLKTMIKAGFITVQKAQEYFPDFFEESEYLANSIKSAYEGMTLMEFEDHYEDKIENLPIESYRYLRTYDSGYEAYFELAMLCSRKIPTKSMRNNLIFQRILYIGRRITSTINDLCSIRKEVKTGEGYNIVTYKSRNSTLKESFKEVGKMIEEDVENFRALCSRYKFITNNDSHVNSVLEIIEKVIDGHTYWFTTTKRYGVLDITFTDN